MSSRRQQEAEDLVRRFTDLRPEQARSIMLVLSGNAFVESAVQVVLVVGYVRAARRLLRSRRQGRRTTAYGAVSRPVVALSVAHAVHLVLAGTLLRRWTRRTVHRASQVGTNPRSTQE